MIDAARPGRLPRLRRPAQPQRLLAPREPERREHDPAGRDDRGRRQLRLDATRRSPTHSREFIEGRLRTFGYDGPVDRGRRSASTSTSSPTSATRPNLAWFVGHNTIRLRGRRLRPARDRASSSRAMDRFVREAMDAGALGMSTGLEFNPGREATTDELVAPERDRRRVRRHLHEPRPQPRLAASCDSIDEFLDGRPRRRDRGEISHLNVRHRTERAATGAGSARSTRWQAAREVEGIDVLADTTPFLRRPRPDGRDPAAVGRAPTAGRRRSRACATRDARERLRTSATATGASSTRASGTACACRRAQQHPELGRPHVRRDRRPRARPTRGTATSTSSPTRATPTRASSSSAGSSPTSTWPR